MANGDARVAASFVHQAADLFARRTGTLVTLVSLPFRVVTDRRYFTRFVTRRWLDLLHRAAWHRDLLVPASTLNDLGPRAWITRPAVTGRRALVLPAVQRIVAHLLARFVRVPDQAVATFPVAQMPAAEPRLHALLVAVELLAARDFLLVAAASARLGDHL